MHLMEHMYCMAPRGILSQDCHLVGMFLDLLTIVVASSSRIKEPFKVVELVLKLDHHQGRPRRCYFPSFSASSLLNV